jgi:hypothetical protein
MPKPGNFFIGIYELFALLVPGVLFVLAAGWVGSGELFRPEHAFHWVSLLLLGYLAGHVLQMPVPYIDRWLLPDWVYGRTVSPGPAEAAEVPKGARLILAVSGLRNAEICELHRLSGIAGATLGRKGLSSAMQVSTIFDFAYASMIVAKGAERAEIDRLQADAKMFCNTATGAAIVALLSVGVGLLTRGTRPMLFAVAILSAAVVLLALVRYVYLRWKALVFLYQYVIVRGPMDRRSKRAAEPSRRRPRSTSTLVAPP